MVLQAVFIDAGNTLLYEKPSRFEIYAQAARGRGIDIDSDRMRVLMIRAHRELPREIDGAFRYSESWFQSYVRTIFHGSLGLSSTELAGISAEVFSRFADPKTFALFPGTIELLDALRTRGIVIGIISNWSQRLPGILEGIGVLARVDFVLASAIERVEKPDPEIFRRACARSGVQPGDALHAGDHPEKDVAGALRAGLRAVLVEHPTPGGDSRRLEPLRNLTESATSGQRVGSLMELADLVARLP
jgi:putative hydrolase of the HAD superfamily